MKCPKCQYEWESKSKMIYICCPNCRHQFKQKQEVDKDEGNGTK
jgi:uncharacterized Zn ribbon protein